MLILSFHGDRLAPRSRRHPSFCEIPTCAPTGVASRPRRRCSGRQLLSDHNWLISSAYRRKQGGVLWPFSERDLVGWTAPKACRCAGASG